MNTETVILTSRQGRSISFTVENSRISEIDNQSGVRFPFSVGQPNNMSIKSWAQNNGFKWNGKDLDDDNKKIFGVRIKDVPKGHEWRMMFPNKFR